MNKIKLVISNWQLVIGIIMFGIFLITIYYLPFTGNAQALPEFMLTWKANNYAPASYQGKVLPANGTKVDVAMELIDNGKLANLSGTEVRWFVNRKLSAFGSGLKNFSFTADRFRGDQVVEVTLVDYKGQGLTKRIVIPVVSPEVAIDGGPNIFRALLYFFNVQNLSQIKITWSASGNEASGLVENPDILNLDTTGVPSETEINLQLTVQNLLKPIETATKSVTFLTK